MKKQWIGIILAVAMLPGVAALAQSAAPPFPVTLEKQLAARASNYTEVTLNRKMLEFASHFMDKEDDAEGKRIISKLNGVYVRTYEFDKEGQYTAADLESIRRQFETPEWSPLVKQRSKSGEDDSDIYIKMAGTESQGMFILNAEPKELDFVYISGPIDPDDLSGISGNFGIPKTAKTMKAGDK
ncbi:MAG: DUF4252 domain-containing protein [Silvibacterium sp.]